jgi:hypothetical protein
LYEILYHKNHLCTFESVHYNQQVYYIRIKHCRKTVYNKAVGTTAISPAACRNVGKVMDA